MYTHKFHVFVAAAALLGLQSCVQAHAGTSKMTAATPFYAAPFEKTPDPASLTALGRALFFDPALSASGKLSCASCHDPQHAYSAPNGHAVQYGGAHMKQAGLRAVPTLMYEQNIPPFSEHFQEDDGNDSEDQGATGGRDWDGRAASAHDQALAPLLSPFEMANQDAAAIVARLQHAPLAAAFRQAFGEHLFDDTPLAFAAVLRALEVYQQSPQEFYPYTSKYDAYLRRQTTLSAQEMRGLQVFNDPRKGNCASCHPSRIQEGGFPNFTDYGFVATGAPRNREIPANADPHYYDLGLCGPLRKDLQNRPEYCGLFKTPTLRNVTLRKTFFHNGVFKDLRSVVAFYAQRDTQPEKWYGRDRHGKVLAYDDLPQRYRGNLNEEAPFGGKPGEAAALSEAEIDDVVAFLQTLTDSYTPAR